VELGELVTLVALAPGVTVTTMSAVAIVAEATLERVKSVFKLTVNFVLVDEIFKGWKDWIMSVAISCCVAAEVLFRITVAVIGSFNIVDSTAKAIVEGII
jgi:hypothetical protein